MDNKTRGFTLIELVITIAVIAIISAIILPNFIGTTEKTRLKADIQSARVLQNAADLYDAEQSSSLERKSVDTDIGKLVDKGYLSDTPLVQTDKAKWVYVDKKVKLNVKECDSKTTEAASKLNEQEKNMLTELTEPEE